MLQSDGAAALNSKIGARALSFLLVEPTSGRALSAFSQCDSESESESDGVCTRVVRESGIASWWRHYS
jgi:hypothetical protein